MKSKNLSRLIKCTAAVTASVCTAIITSVGYYSSTLPDEFRTSPDSSIELHTSLPVTACELAKSRAAVSGINSPGSERLSLKLFGSVPIKEADKKTVDRPVLAAGGQAFGIKLITDGVMIIDMKKTNGICPAADAGLKIGDIIEAVNGERVSSNSQVSEIIRASQGRECTIKFRRDEISRQCSLKPVLYDGSYRAGMWVRDSSAGIGTMTFIDTETMTFAGLGHAICDSDTHELLPLSKGSITPIKITGCCKSRKGEPGQLSGEFSGADCGSLFLNCTDGVYGKLDTISEEYVSYPLGFSHEVHEGRAEIITQLSDSKPEHYEITIESISGEADHDMIIKVTDKSLIKKTGGIIQGMSGSPIIQDGRLVGAVTHVFIDDPKGGYAVFAETMYENARKASALAEECTDNLAG